TIASARRGLRAEALYFVPLGETLEVWRLRLTNLRPEQRAVSVFSSVEFCLWDAEDDARNFQRNLSTGEVEIEDGVIYHTTEYRERRNHFAYFACSEEPAGFDTQREAFLGAYRGWDRPLVVERGRSADSVAHGWAPIGSHHVRLELGPGEEREVLFVLGYAENPGGEKFAGPPGVAVNKSRVRRLLEAWLKPEAVELGLDRLRERWRDLLGTLQVETPNEHTNRMVNAWNAYQCAVTFNLSRSASLFESGIGRGIGFRDSNQDLLGFVHMSPKRARQRILDLAATQLESGAAYHQYQPLTRRGNDALGAGFNDDPLWLVLSVAAYLKETGDLDLLDERVPFDLEPGSERPLLDHLCRSVRYTLDRLGPHGLPLIGRADWNDCLNLNCFSDTPGESFQTTENKEGGVAESVFIGGLFCLAAKELAGIAYLREQHDDAKKYLDAGETMAATVTEHGWDGDWFLRAYDYFGNKVGTAANAEGQIFVEPQGICVMGGIGLDDGRAVQALASVRERLAYEHGIRILQPAFTHYYVELG
ncbi:MAG: hypothetical protein J2O47_10170, partial [Acidimicrobiaceae bacterium]|nr:hypothetical protein [Acidimicrobiaceae bacterium]